MAEISIIILTYNSSNHILTCLESLFKFHENSLKEKKLELIIVDNNSTDDTRELIASFLKERQGSDNIKFIQVNSNPGFAAGINSGVKRADGKILLFLNPDSKFVNDSLLEVVRDFEDEKIAIVGGKMVNEREVEKSAGNFYTLFNILFMSIGLEDAVGIRSAPSIKKEVDYVSGGFMFVGKEVFEELSGFDEKYFMYVEDMDLCFRAKTKGYKVVYDPSINIEHYRHGSSSRSFAVVNIYKGIYYFFKKNKGQFQYLAVRTMLSIKSILVVILGLVLRNGYYIKTYKRTLSI